MRVKLLAWCLLAAAFFAGLSRPEALSAAPPAHPLGNFTVNSYSRMEIAADRADVLYILDMAEIPAYQELSALPEGGAAQPGRDRYLRDQAAALAGGLSLTVDGRATPLELRGQSLATPEGQGGLRTLRIELRLSASLAAPKRIDYRDSNYEGRLGWHEIVVVPAAGLAVNTDAATADRSDQLRSYPADMLSSPLDRRSARIDVTRAADGSPAVVNAAADPSATPAVTAPWAAADSFAALLVSPTLSPLALVLALLTAALLGAFHALAPGHGKTIVAAYLVGSRGTARHALYLGLTVTITHTAGVFALGLITLSASRYILPEQLFPWLSLASGLLVAAMGLALARQRFGKLRSRRPGKQLANHDHGAGGLWHEHGPDTHTHVPPAAGLSGRSIVALGVSGGLLPCPSALVVLLGAISLGRIGLGIALILAFSLGLAGVLTGIGLLMLYGARWLRRGPEYPRLNGALGAGVRIASRGLAAMPLASALIVLLLGVIMATRALMGIV